MTDVYLLLQKYNDREYKINLDYEEYLDTTREDYDKYHEEFYIIEMMQNAIKFTTKLVNESLNRHASYKELFQITKKLNDEFENNLQKFLKDFGAVKRDGVEKFTLHNYVFDENGDFIEDDNLSYSFNRESLKEKKYEKIFNDFIHFRIETQLKIDEFNENVDAYMKTHKGYVPTFIIAKNVTNYRLIPIPGGYMIKFFDIIDENGPSIIKELNKKSLEQLYFKYMELKRKQLNKMLWRLHYKIPLDVAITTADSELFPDLIADEILMYVFKNGSFNTDKSYETCLKCNKRIMTE